LLDILARFPRQALHARRLGLEHPASGEEMQFESPLPEDFVDLLAVLERDAAEG
jgi:23S rRNA pseudouridine1911/1915/1917 synthase